MNSHITIIERRASRRIMEMKAGGKRRQLCGADATERDQTYADARRAAKAGTLEKWVTCPACREIFRNVVMTEPMVTRPANEIENIEFRHSDLSEASIRVGMDRNGCWCIATYWPAGIQGFPDVNRTPDIQMATAIMRAAIKELEQMGFKRVATKLRAQAVVGAWMVGGADPLCDPFAGGVK